MAKKSEATSPRKAGRPAPEADINDEGEFYDAEESFAQINPSSPTHHPEGNAPGFPIANMGNANSTQAEISAKLHATTQAIRDGRTAPTTTTRSSTTQRRSTGRLKQPSKSTSHNDAASRNPAPAASAQRPLAARTGKRGSAYDIPGESPVKQPVEAAKPQFSPLKKQKNSARRAPAAEEESAGGGGEDAADDNRYRDFFTDAEIRQHEVEAAVEETAPGAQHDDETNEVPVTPKRGRGRPPKKSSEATTREQAENAPTSAIDLNDAQRPTHSKGTNAKEPPADRLPAESGAKQRMPQPKAKKRAGGSSTLDKLHRRRSQVDGEAEDLPDEVEGGDLDPLLATDGAEKRPAVPPIDQPRPSELYDVEGESGDGEENTLSAPRPAQGTKRQASSQPAKANTKQKRARFGQSTRSDEADDDDGSSRTRLFGQWPAFAEVIKKADNIGRSVQDNLPGDRNDVRLTDADVKATVRLCSKAIQLYNAMKSHDGPIEPEQDPANLLNDIDKRVDRLRGLDDDHPTNFDNDTRATEIYFHLMRGLVALTKAAILCYEALDTRGAEGGQITFGHANTVVTLLQVILDLAKSSEKYDRPPSNLHVVQPVRQFIPILRRISRVISNQIHANTQSQHLARRVERDRLHRAAEAEAYRKRQQQEAVARTWRHKWQDLHLERMLAEGGLMPTAKRQHLQIQDHYYYTEYDQNGEPFQREEIFAFRKGPLPVFIEAAQKMEWTMVELSTLCDGLKDYTGEHVFERIFRKYCRRGRELNRFNVTEIVVTAAGMKDMLVKDREKYYGGDTEQWILDIPVWTSAHHGEGQENMDVAGDEEVDVTMSGALPDEVEVVEAAA